MAEDFNAIVKEIEEEKQPPDIKQISPDVIAKVKRNSVVFSRDGIKISFEIPDEMDEKDAVNAIFWEFRLARIGKAAYKNTLQSKM